MAELPVPPPEPDSRALIGVSGGRDSVALLHALTAAGWNDLIVCHLDHSLRPESAADAQFVHELAARYGLEVAIEREDVSSHARTARQSIETAGRTARYEFFARTAKERIRNRLFLAHHADDQAETLLMRLLRGSGIGGLQGMRTETIRVINGVELRICRPLLAVWRSEIDRYIAAHALPFREDASNAEARYTRNRVRHEILPLLEAALGRDVRKALCRTAQILEAENEYFASLPVLSTPLPVELEANRLREMPLAIQRRVLHKWLTERGVRDVSYTDVENVRGLLYFEQPAKINLACGAHARRRAGLLFLELSPA